MMTCIQDFLREQLGLDPQSLGIQVVEQALKTRMAACGVHASLEYLARVTRCDVERQALIEQLVVPETWFFRDQEPFTFLKQVVMKDWLPRHASGAFRVLSAPCSTGEEPYSISMALRDLGLAGTRYHIDAVDISQTALQRARAAVYGNNSFRGLTEAWRRQYFEVQGERQVLKPEYRVNVTFHWGNLLDDRLLAAEPPYDVVFCRNVLIYLLPAVRERVMKTLRRLLRTQGVLFVGHAETSVAANAQFEALSTSAAFAFKKREDEPLSNVYFEADSRAAAAASVNRGYGIQGESRNDQPTAMQACSDGVGRNDAEGWVAQTRDRLSGVGEPTGSPDVFPPAPECCGSGMRDRVEARFEEARRLADQGRRVEAEGVCERQAREGLADARVFCLLGLLREASGKLAEAETCYTKALYLDASFEEAMLHLALLKEQQGNAEGARALKQRASRVREKARAAGVPS